MILSETLQLLKFFPDWELSAYAITPSSTSLCFYRYPGLYARINISNAEDITKLKLEKLFEGSIKEMKDGFS